MKTPAPRVSSAEPPVAGAWLIRKIWIIKMCAPRVSCAAPWRTLSRHAVKIFVRAALIRFCKNWIMKMGAPRVSCMAVSGGDWWPRAKLGAP